MSTLDEARVTNASMAIIRLIRQPGTGLTRGEATLALLFALAEVAAAHDLAQHEKVMADIHKTLDQMFDAHVKGVRT